MQHNATNCRTPRPQPKSTRKGDGVKVGVRGAFLHPAVKLDKRVGDETYLRFLEAIDSPIALSVWMLYKYGEHRQLVALKVDPHNYNDAQLFRKDYAASRFFAKSIGLRTGIDLARTAVDSASKAEDLCRTTNQRILSYRNGSVRNPFGGEWFAAQRLIARILGPVPSRFEDGGWSRGRTSASWGDKVAGIHKYASRLDVTWSAQIHALNLLRQSPHWGAAALDADGPCSVTRSALNIVDWNTMITVPKSAKTDRVICYEPALNIRLQRNVGSYIARRLSRFGVKLDDQTVNQRRSAFAAKHGALATIDLSMASDTLSLELVYELLPIDWAILLDDLRSKNTKWPDGSVRRNEKFSSMGNGFTFELESLIFYALACSVTENVSVFGDDIICPVDMYDAVVGVLSSAGFTVNLDKSFKTSYFRESCGNDCFGTVNVTPVYLRNLISSVSDMLHVHNRIREWCMRDPIPERLFSSVLEWMRNTVPSHLGPFGAGDGHYHVDFETACPKRAGFGVDGWWYKSWDEVIRVSTLYGDRVSGHFSGRYGFAALCAAIGPKQARDVVLSSVDRRLVVHVERRGLASFSWPSIVWY